jgi:hypothetical protein
MKATIAAASLLISSTAFAIPGLPFSPSHKAKRTTQDVSGCTDFSGAWIGSCDGGEGSSEMTAIKIEQNGCKYLDINDETYPIGGTRSSQTHDADFSSTETDLVDWTDAEKTTLNFDMNFTERRIDAFSNWSSKSTIVARIVDGAMIFTLSISSKSPNSEESNQMELTCRFTKASK